VTAQVIKTSEFIVSDIGAPLCVSRKG
jgi:hypothetical protein